MEKTGVIENLLVSPETTPYDEDGVEHATIQLLEAIGEDLEREGLLKTPSRVSRMYAEILNGYQADPEVLINGALFQADSAGMVVIRDIEFQSLCEHHLLPFMGRVHVAYVPNVKVIGLSKRPRRVDMYAHRLQIQERMTSQIRYRVATVLQPQRFAVVT